MSIIAKRYNRDVYRLMDDQNAIIGFAIRLTNGKWSMNDASDRRLDSIQYSSPSEVAKGFAVVRLPTV